MYAITDNNQHPQAVRKGQTSHPPNPDAPRPKQGRSSEADPRFTFHASRFTVPESEARTLLADFFNNLLKFCPATFQLLHNLRHGCILHLVEGQPVRLEGAMQTQNIRYPIRVPPRFIVG